MRTSGIPAGLSLRLLVTIVVVVVVAVVVLLNAISEFRPDSNRIL